MTSRRARPADSITLERGSLLLHQSITFDADGPESRRALLESVLFRGAVKDGAVRAEWIRAQPDGESYGCPLGVVTLANGAALLEAWSEERLARLRRAFESAVPGRHAADETRVFPLEEALHRPEALFAATTAHEVARRHIREAWAFVSREDLHHRPPVTAMRTGRGQEAILRAWPAALAEIREDAPSFPEMTIEELRAVLFDDRAAVPSSSSAPSPAAQSPASTPRPAR